MVSKQDLFFAPCSQEHKKWAYRNFEDTVVNGVSREEHDITLDSAPDRVSVWGVVSGNKPVWEQLESGDIILFYTMKGVYTHAAQVHSTETNEDLGDRIWTTYDEGRLVSNLEEPWPFIIYFQDVVKVNIPVEEIHPVVGWSTDYPLGFTRVADEGQQQLREEFGSALGLVRTYTRNRTVSNRDVINQEKEELLDTISNRPTLTVSEVAKTDAERLVRSQAFRSAILELYDERCAVCGTNLYSPMGNPAVEAAHIYPRSEQGPDDVRNGLALCRRHHWGFDVGWFSLSDDNKMLIRETTEVPGYEEFQKFDQRRIRIPDSPDHRPHPVFKSAHRELHGFNK